MADTRGATAVDVDGIDRHVGGGAESPLAGTVGAGHCERCARMHYSDYLREQAAEYRELAKKADDPAIKSELLELAVACEEVAADIDDRRASG